MCSVIASNKTLEFLCKTEQIQDYHRGGLTLCDLSPGSSEVPARDASLPEAGGAVCPCPATEPAPPLTAPWGPSPPLSPSRHPSTLPGAAMSPLPPLASCG